MSIKIAKYHDGDIVIVDRSSSGKPCSSISELWHESLPGYEYTRALFDLTVMRHYFFNSNFTLREQ